MVEDATLATVGSTFGYTDAQLDAMPVWLVGIRLGLAEGSDGYPMRTGDMMTRAEADRIREMRENRTAGKRSGRARPEGWTPRVSDPGRVFTGDDAR